MAELGAHGRKQAKSFLSAQFRAKLKKHSELRII